MSNSLQWEVTIPARTVHGRRLMSVPLDLPDGITGTIVDDGTEIVLTVLVLAPAHDDAIELARREATDLLLVLSSSFTPFELTPDCEFRVVPVGPGHTNTLKLGAWAPDTPPHHPSTIFAGSTGARSGRSTAVGTFGGQSDGYRDEGKPAAQVGNGMSGMIDHQGGVITRGRGVRLSAPSGVREAGSVVEDLLRRAMQSVRHRDGAVLLAADGPDRPDLILVDRAVGLYAIDLEPHGCSPEDRAPFVRLNRKRAELRESLGDLVPAGVGAALVLGAATQPVSGAGGSPVLTAPDLDDPTWPDRLPARTLNNAAFNAVVERLAPSVVFTRHGRTTTSDPGAAGRAATRIQLDATQAGTALAPIEDVAVVSGPPGSGKTLMLAARARHLAATHPDWRIVVVVFNRALVPYVADLVDTPSVTVATVGRFADSLGLRVDFQGGESAARELARARSRGISRAVDALLVDEAQDFDPAWLELLLDTVRPGRGGILIAGDSAQSLYREPDLDVVLSRRNVVRYTLVRPYRSTGSILRAAAALASVDAVGGVGWAMEGEPIDLVWASSWDEQAACVAAEVQAMIVDGQRGPGDIAVLVTKRAGALRRLRLALDHRHVPYEVVDRSNAASFNPGTPTVKLITVHSSKGHEFPVVVLFGLEALPSGVDEATRRQERVGFVGATRAKDQLLITYTRANAHLERLIALGDDVRCWSWPDDYEED